MTSGLIVARWGQMGLQLRGNLAPVMLGGKERWFDGGDVVQRNDLSYRLTRGVVALGWVSPGGLEPYLGLWYAKGTQVRTDFVTSGTPLPPGLIVHEEIWSRGLVLGVQGLSSQARNRAMMRFYGDLVMIPNIGPLRATVTNSFTNSFVPDTRIDSWGLGFQGGGGYGFLFGSGPEKLTISLEANMTFLYYGGKARRDIPGFIFVEWPRNLTMGWSFMVSFGGGWFSGMKAALTPASAE